MSKRHREGKRWEKVVVWSVAFIAYFCFFTWAESRISPDDLSIPTQWLAVGFAMFEAFLFGLMTYQVLEFIHAVRARRRERRLRQTIARIHFPR